MRPPSSKQRITHDAADRARLASLPVRVGAWRLSAVAGWTVLFVAVALLVWFGTLGLRHLVGPDEGRYAEISREMLATGDWVTIRYNALKYFEKPPFHMWSTAATYALFGVGEWQARLTVALAGLLGIGMSMLATWRWFGPRAAAFAGLALLAAPMWSVAAHFNTLDMTLAGVMSCILGCMLVAQHPDASRASRRGWMVACWAAMGVAILTKGLVGIALPGLVLVVYTLITRDWGLWRRLHLTAGAVIMLVIVMPWFYLVAQRNPEFLNFFFIHEHWQRYTSGVHARGGPIVYFVPLVLAGFLPWAGLFPRLWKAMRGAAPAGDSGAGVRFRPALMAGVWAIAIFVFFSLSRSKLPGYIVPVFPALGILAGVALDRMDARAWGRQLQAMAIVAICGLLASPIVATLNANHTPNTFYRAYAVWVAVAFVVMLLAVMAARVLLRRHGVLPSVAVYALGMYMGFTAALLGHETVGGPASGADLVPQISQRLTPGMKLYGVNMLDHTLPFYLGHPLTMVGPADELTFGTTMEPQRWVPDLATFETIWRQGEPAMAVMSPQTYLELSPSIPLYVVARDWRRVVVTNVPGPAPLQKR
ncbi:glycosyltransferase family 39 protein [Cupriavidus sp.]|uniref:glycosyltransferase family 39 protein n=2 Tax=Cupriavidus sp. TaxID=1873897 RepID=UPI0025C021D3|nr:glycosyltransferase family 39 protein [Cupriavidus sp.]MCA3190700.1 glycosyltransferase family 39 protein [Cupriavidus sp.]MCA3199213.1 glycosyltransferase family 39 protein [Cupriavidus sp.]MCA3205150.1 glycosyltransferase family 39 protein [Cupriavidus sp.]